MSFWLASLIVVGASLSACVFSDLRRAVLALWVAGLGVGGVYLSLGAELLAVVQWSVSTLVAISFFFYATLFGELGSPDGRPARKQAIAALLPTLMGLALVAVIALSAQRLLGWSLEDLLSVSRPSEDQNLVVIGRRLVTDHLPALQILSMLLFMSVIGAGVISRPEIKGNEQEPEEGA